MILNVDGYFEIYSRKRSLQDCDDGACDFVPLSKRINNLHLTRPVIGDEALQGAHKVEAHHNHHHDLPAPHQHNGHSSNGFMNGVNGHNGLPETNQYQQQPSPGPSTVAPWVTDQMMAQYAPQIEQVDSPYYYEHNKLLFALYLERLQRNPQNRPLS